MLMSRALAIRSARALQRGVSSVPYSDLQQAGCLEFMAKHNGLTQVRPLLQAMGLGGRRVLVIQSKSAAKNDAGRQACYFLARAGVTPIPYTMPDALATLADTDEVTAAAQRVGVDGVVGVGGGATLATARAVAMLLTTTGKAKSFVRALGGTSGLPADALPCVLVPTSPSGAELSSQHALLNAKHEAQFTLALPAQAPYALVLDSDLYKAMPPAAWAKAGMAQLMAAIAGSTAAGARWAAPPSPSAAAAAQALAPLAISHLGAATLAVAQLGKSKPRPAHLGMAVGSSYASAVQSGVGDTLPGAFAMAICGRYDIPRRDVLGAVGPACLQYTLEQLDDDRVAEQDAEVLERALNRAAKLLSQVHHASAERLAQGFGADGLLDPSVLAPEQPGAHAGQLEGLVEAWVSRVCDALGSDSWVPSLDDAEFTTVDMERIASAAEVAPGAMAQLVPPRRAHLLDMLKDLC